MELSKRLQSVAGLVTSGLRLADVGTDHAYIPIYLVKQKKIPGAVAMDVKEGPLERARTNIEIYQLGNYIETRLSDGLQALQPGEVQAVVIAGMGGPLMERIMQAGQQVLATIEECVLQPQSEIERFRWFLKENGYCITAEDMVEEEGKYYPMMRVCHGNMEFEDPIEAKFGPCLLREKNATLYAFLKQREQLQKTILQRIRQNGRQNIEMQISEIEKEMQKISAALSYYEM